MFGANLVSMQKLLGNSDLKITERRYGHLLPNFMQAEVNRLRFGLGRLFPRQPPSLPDPLPHFAGARETEREEAGTPRISPSDSGLFSGGEYGTRTSRRQ